MKHSRVTVKRTERISVCLAIKTFIDNMVQWFQSQQDLTAVLLPIVFSQDEPRNDVYSFAHQKNEEAPTTAIFKKTGLDVLNNIKEAKCPLEIGARAEFLWIRKMKQLGPQQLKFFHHFISRPQQSLPEWGPGFRWELVPLGAALSVLWAHCVPPFCMGWQPCVQLPGQLSHSASLGHRR